MTRSILLIGCFDTKEAVFSHLRNCILARGEPVITVDTSVLGTTTDFPVDYGADTVARAAGSSIDELRSRQDRGRAIDVMGAGAAAIVRNLVGEGRIKGAVGMGGGGGTFIALTAMQEVPFGIPKLCLSTLAAKDLSRRVGHKDITLMASVVDIADLNSIITPLIEQAAAAICAMANVTPASPQERAGRIAVSMFGNTTACADQCTQLLKTLGYDVLAFHANGIGGRTMESLIREGQFDAVLDITTTELADDLCDGICSAGPDRLLAAVQTGIPAVVVPGCLDMVNFGHPDTVPVHFQNRHLYSWAPDVTLMRTNEVENRELGLRLATKLNQSVGPVEVILPLKGVSQVDAAGGVFYRPDLDTVLFESTKKNLSDRIPLIESDAHINDKEFADLLISRLIQLMKRDKISLEKPQNQ